MSETSTIRADSPVCQQSGDDDDVNLRKPLLIDEEYEVKTPNQYLPTYAAQLSRLQQRLSQNDRNLGDSAVVSSGQIIIFDDHPSYLVPRAKIADPELDRKLAAWHWSTSPDAASPSVGHIFLAHQLLTLVTNFTRDAGNDTKTDIAKTLLQARCIEALEEFTTPTTYRSRQIESRHYYGICLALHQHRNHLVRDARGGRIGRVLGRLSSWVPHQDGVTLYIQSLCGGSSSLHLSWQDACDPASKAISFPPLLNREADASRPPWPNYTTMETKMTGGSSAIEPKLASGDNLLHSHSKAIRVKPVGRLTRDRRGGKTKMRANLSDTRRLSLAPSLRRIPPKQTCEVCRENEHSCGGNDV